MSQPVAPAALAPYSQPGFVYRAFVILLAVLTATFAAPADGALPGKNGCLAYGLEVWGDSSDGTYFIAAYVGTIGPDGGGRRLLALGWEPSFSPDGKAVALAREDRDGLVVLLPQQVRWRKITRGEDYSPSFAPNGRRIVFARQSCRLVNEDYIECAPRGIFTVGRRGNGLRQIAADGSHPAWSSRGEIAVSVDAGIAVIDPSGTPRRLIAPGGSSPDWSPRGERLAFVRDGALWIANADGSGERRLRGGGPAAPAWSPDGKRIAFFIGDGIYAIRSTGGSARRIASGLCRSFCEEELAEPASLAWQPLPTR